MLAIILLSLLPLSTIAQFPSPTAYYTSSLVFVPNIYKIYWNASSTSITAEIAVQTLGWVGFGISTTGDMPGSDLIVAWIDSTGYTNFTDRYVTSDRQVKIDSKQDWFLLAGKQTNGFTIIKFTRLIDTCDTAQDLVIPGQTTKIIIAWGTTAPSSGNNITYHGTSNRAPVAMLLLSSLSSPLVITPADNAQLYNFTLNVIF